MLNFLYSTQGKKALGKRKLQNFPFIHKITFFFRYFSSCKDGNYCYADKFPCVTNVNAMHINLFGSILKMKVHWKLQGLVNIQF